MDEQSKWPFGQIDLLFSYVGLVLAILFFALLSMNPPAKDNPDTLPPPGNIAVLVCWPEGAIDVDTWLGAPNDKAVGYSRREGLIWALLRDDRGTVDDPGPVNCESGFGRLTPAGEYAINIHGYSVLAGKVTVHIDVSMNGVTLVKTNMDVRQGQERTVVRFTLDGQGSIVPGSQSQVYKPLRSAT